jgi:RNA polymerase sigma-70 factor (ECF subfamily)
MRMETTFRTEVEGYDQRVLVGIYETHSPGIFRYAYRLLGDQYLAEECVAETFSRFLQSLLKRQAAVDNVQAYLYRIAHNWITDHYRRRPPDQVELDPEGHPDHGSNPSHLVIEALETERVRTALRQLPDEQRAVVLLRVLDGWRHEQVAELLGKSVEATRALQYRAMNALKRILSEQEEDEL